MAKQNKDQSFAGKRKQNRDTNRKTTKEVKKEQKEKREKKYCVEFFKNIIIWVIPIALAMITICYGLNLGSWAKEVGKSSVCLDFIAEKMFDAVMMIIELLLFLGTVCCILKRKNMGACVIVSLMIGVILYGLLATRAKVAAAVYANRETLVVASVEKCAETLSSIQGKTVYQLPLYVLEKDVFMENLGSYCGIPENSISQENRPGIMAEILSQYLKSNFIEISEKELPSSYETNVLRGNVMYNSFTDFIEESEKSENASIKNDIYNYALQSLDEGIKYRIEADNSLHTAENRRLIGVYNIDAGVCNQCIGEINLAAKCYEDAAEWAVKSIYSAAIINDMKAMKDAWKVLNNATISLEEVEQSSDGDRVQMVKSIREAYKIVIDQWK